MSKNGFASAVEQALKTSQKAAPRNNFEDTPTARHIALLLATGKSLTDLADKKEDGQPDVRVTVIDGEVKSRGAFVVIDGDTYLVSASKMTPA